MVESRAVWLGRAWRRSPEFGMAFAGQGGTSPCWEICGLQRGDVVCSEIKLRAGAERYEPQIYGERFVCRGSVWHR